MASQAFKQQCPSCEAMVPIRDAGLIGRKIDCPKCKYRFVVEEPAPVEADDDDAPPTKGKKGDKATPAKGAKGKKGAKGDEDDGGKSKKKKAAASSTTMIGMGIAGVAVLALAGVYFSGMLGGSTPTKPNTQGGGGSQVANNNPINNAVNPADGGADRDKDGVKPENPGVSPVVDNSTPAGDITNYLPPETQYVVWARVEELLRTDLKSIVLGNNSPFKKQAFFDTFHFPVDSITQIVQGHNLDKRWIFTIMRTTSDIPMKALEKSLGLKAEPAIKGRAYYTINGAMDSLGNILFKGGAAHAKFTLYKLDRNTLVFADVQAMTEFLEAGTRFKHQTVPLPTAEKKEEKKEEPKDVKDPKEQDRPGNPTDVNPPRPKKGGMIQIGDGPAGDKPGDKPADKPKEKIELPVASGSYLTLNRELKSILDRLRTGDDQPLVSIAGPFKLPTDFELARLYKAWAQVAGTYVITGKLVEKAVTSYDKYAKPFVTEIRELEKPLKDVTMAGVGLNRFNVVRIEKKPDSCKVDFVVAADTGSDSLRRRPGCRGE